MDILSSEFSPREAKIKFLDGDYTVLTAGTFVRCAVSGAPIQVSDLKYWSVDKQEPYASAEISFKAYLSDRGIAK